MLFAEVIQFFLEFLQSLVAVSVADRIGPAIPHECLSVCFQIVMALAKFERNVAEHIPVNDDGIESIFLVQAGGLFVDG